MQIQPCTVRLKDGREVLLRSPEAADAQALLDYMRVTSGETHFMARYPEECQATVEQETGFIEALTGHPQNFMARYWVLVWSQDELGIGVQERLDDLGVLLPEH